MESVSQSDPPPSQPILSIPIPRKLCFVCRCPERSDDYSLFIVDLNSDDPDSELTPTILLAGDFFVTRAYCVLGSTLYVFSEGQYGKNNNKLVCKFDIPSNLGVGFRLEETDLVRVCSMSDFKTGVGALPTPDGDKIVVFSGVIDPHSPNRRNFELFDPALGKCRKLPELLTSLDDSWKNSSRPCFIRMVAFFDNSVMFVQTDAGMFTLNLFGKRSRWERLPHFRGASSMMAPFTLIGGDICLTSDYAYDVDVGSLDEDEDECENAFWRWYFTYPGLSESFPFPTLSRLYSKIIPLQVNPHICSFCIVHPGVEETSASMHIPHFVVDVYFCDLQKCREGLSKIRAAETEGTSLSNRSTTSYCLPGAVKLKSFKFRLKPQRSPQLHLHSNLSIPAVP